MHDLIEIKYPTSQPITLLRRTTLGAILGAILWGNSAWVMAQSSAHHVMTSTAVLESKSGSSVNGTLKLHESRDRVVHITGTIEGLTPGKHGFHVHVNGNCDSPDAMSAGGHYAPSGGQHGAPGSKVHHLGDLGNIMANESGRADVDITVSGITIALMGTASIGDRSIVVHAKEDDFTDPVGNSGARVACGVIESDMMRM